MSVYTATYKYQYRILHFIVFRVEFISVSYSIMTNLNCAKLLTKTNWVLLKEGFLFEKDMGKIQLLKLILHVLYCIFIVILIGSSIGRAISIKDISVLNQLLCMFISAITVFAKEFTLLKHRFCFISIVSDARSDTFNAHNTKLNQHVLFVDRISELTLRYYIFIAIIFLSVTCLSPFVLNMKMMIPPPMDIRDYDYLYKIVHCLVIFYMSINSVTFDVLYISILGLCVAQLGILEERLTEIFKEAITKNGTKESYMEHYQVLKECVILHETINQ